MMKLETSDILPAKFLLMGGEGWQETVREEGSRDG